MTMSYCEINTGARYGWQERIDPLPEVCIYICNICTTYRVVQYSLIVYWQALFSRLEYVVDLTHDECQTFTYYMRHQRINHHMAHSL